MPLILKALDLWFNGRIPTDIVSLSEVPNISMRNVFVAFRPSFRDFPSKGGKQGAIAAEVVDGDYFGKFATPSRREKDVHWRFFLYRPIGQKQFVISFPAMLSIYR